MNDMINEIKQLSNEELANILEAISKRTLISSLYERNALIEAANRILYMDIVVTRINKMIGDLEKTNKLYIERINRPCI